MSFMLLRKVREQEQFALIGARLSIATFFLSLSFCLFLQHIHILSASLQSLLSEQEMRVMMSLWFCVQPLPVLLGNAICAFSFQAVSLILLNGAFWHVHKPGLTYLIHRLQLQIHRLQLQVYPSSLDSVGKCQLTYGKCMNDR